MSDDTDSGYADTAPEGADIIERLQRDRDALAERCEKLREALRPYVIIRYRMGGGACRRCHKEWSKRDSERHALGCLAAREDAA